MLKNIVSRETKKISRLGMLYKWPRGRKKNVRQKCNRRKYRMFVRNNNGSWSPFVRGSPLAYFFSLRYCIFSSLPKTKFPLLPFAGLLFCSNK